MCKRNFHFAFLIFCCFATISQAVLGQETASLADLIAKTEQSVVRIETPDGVGSGFVATEDGNVVTNLHVLAGCTEAKVHFIDGKSFDVIGVLATDEDRDIAIISTACTVVTPLKLSSEVPRKGTSVVTFGAPAGLSFSASEGIISAIRSGEEAKKQLGCETGTWLQTTAPISQGNSGGPLVDKQGLVVGVNTFFVARGQNLNFAISSLDIADLLASATGRTATPLATGVAAKSSKKSVEIASDITRGAIRDYLKRSQPMAKELIANVNDKISETENKLQLMKTGRVNKKLRYSSSGYQSERVRNRIQFFFFSDEIKKNVLDETEAELTKLRTLASRMSDHGEGLLLVASVAGPDLSLSSPGSLGRVDSITVSQVTGEAEFHGYIGRTRVSVQGIPTETLLTDQVLTDGLFIFTGVDAYETRLGTENRIARLSNISRDSFIEIGKTLVAEFEPPTPLSENAMALPGDEAVEPAMRDWVDLTGNFKVTAEFVEIIKETVVLRRQSGKVINVPITSLSIKDQEWLRANAAK
jgi:S1-C subfamily serine protease